MSLNKIPTVYISMLAMLPLCSQTFLFGSTMGTSTNFLVVMDADILSNPISFRSKAAMLRLLSSY
ncbi:hypothetical protein ABE237_16965 [Brevibacillus formosus]|uniref:hypothetical protein n=1 Tax=Brevibacillus TaxID=55080 RepID=UPI0018EC2CA0|nr:MULTISPECIES: hypothetical protein [Brevibacillus]MBG9944381.1 hypothetical protein [Brevibacillus formosus]MED1946265.1 hypothetical protein [Brevibacillus formosus]MED1998813.1 hypothetical protein [Brevibacillus formosus]MED2084130.1 hypothetical protein [Brevibacillus formosus]